MTPLLFTILKTDLVIKTLSDYTLAYRLVVSIFLQKSAGFHVHKVKWKIKDTAYFHISLLSTELQMNSEIEPGQCHFKFGGLRFVELVPLLELKLSGITTLGLKMWTLV